MAESQEVWEMGKLVYGFPPWKPEHMRGNDTLPFLVALGFIKVDENDLYYLMTPPPKWTKEKGSEHLGMAFKLDGYTTLYQFGYPIGGRPVYMDILSADKKVLALAGLG